MLVAAIKDLFPKWNNQELVSGKNAVRFEPTSQRKSNGKPTLTTSGLKLGGCPNTSREES